MSERRPAEWMCCLDERILEHLQREGWATPRHIERTFSMNASEGRTQERLKMLADAGLVAPFFESSRMYELTGEGKRYLEGELDAKHQPFPYIG
ncbi:winged helix-turn-helix domain-containing protein [Natronomonas gomsonensis]|uniref:winged helix-turn-helix domain-containing protein n=1 Tax=Natronomonas gomsonensis TaxID=1046043 RepID=UPI0015BFDE29|nr:winged helix-turn-helix domain-containing protein [Natronomonas gomsonensis]